jgi:hypothetical protein
MYPCSPVPERPYALFTRYQLELAISQTKDMLLYVTDLWQIDQEISRLNKLELELRLR